MKTVGPLQDRNRLRWIALLAVTIMLVSPAIPSEAGAGQPPASHQANQQLPAEKQTTLGRYLTAREAFEKWKAESMKPIIVDVSHPRRILVRGSCRHGLERSCCSSVLCLGLYDTPVPYAAYGTKQTCSMRRRMSAFASKAELTAAP
jgi:hypothetical protein